MTDITRDAALAAGAREDGSRLVFPDAASLDRWKHAVRGEDGPPFMLSNGSHHAVSSHGPGYVGTSGRWDLWVGEVPTILPPLAKDAFVINPDGVVSDMTLDRLFSALTGYEARLRKPPPWVELTEADFGALSCEMNDDLAGRSLCEVLYPPIRLGATRGLPVLEFGTVYMLRPFEDFEDVAR